MFIDGRELDRSELPFRYYGTSRWDAQPRDLGQPPPEPEVTEPSEPVQPRQNPPIVSFDIHGWQPSPWLASDEELVPKAPRRVPLGATDPDWNLQPASQAIALPAPVSPWLFPFDLPLELMGLLLGGQDDFTTTIELPQTPIEERPSAEFRPLELDRVAERARQARTTR